MKQLFFDINKQQHHFSLGRMSALFIIAIILFVVLAIRLFWLTHVSNLKDKRDTRFIQTESDHRWRHNIVDRHNQPLALAYYVYHIGLAPGKLASYTHDQKKQLESLLEINEQELEQFSQKKKFGYLRKSLTLSFEKLAQLRKLPHLTVDKQLRRYYPLGECTSPLIGFINHQGHGSEGLEYVFDKALVLEQNLALTWSSPRGQKKLLSTPSLASEHSLRLSIDSRLQSLLYTKVKEIFSRYSMHSLSAVILSPLDFSLQAVVSYPSYDPHQRPAYDHNYRLKAISDIFEPGSVIKPLTMAFLLEENPQLVHETVKTDPGYFYLDNHRIRDLGNNGTLTLEDILVHSSNVGISKLVLENASGKLCDFWSQFSLMQGSQIEFRPEGHGDLPKYILPGSFSEATMSFGYGFKMNLIQLAQLYAVIAGDGTFKPVTLLAGDKSHREDKQIFSEQTVLKMRQILQAPVARGTAKRAFCEDVAVAGKTGTARRLDKDGQYEQVYNSFFAGFFPADNPRYVIAVYADDPKEQYYGGVICAPLVGEIAKSLMQLPELD